MLDQAAARNVYDRLERMELHTMLASEPDASHDLVVAADVFVYVGRLDEIAAQTRRVLRTDGLFVFSVESLDALMPVTTRDEFKLMPTGRYAHGAAYVRSLATAHGFDVLHLEGTHGRLDKGQDHEHYLVLLRRRGN